MSASSPVPSMRVTSTPAASSRSATMSVVRVSAHDSSGWACRSRRSSTSSSVYLSTHRVDGRGGISGVGGWDRHRPSEVSSPSALDGIGRPCPVVGRHDEVRRDRGVELRRESTRRRMSSRIAATPGERRSRSASSSRTSAQVKSSCCPARLASSPASPRWSRCDSTCCQTSSTPSPVRPEQVTTGAAHSPRPCTSRRAPASSRAAVRASPSRSPSALFTAITSAISRMPFLMPCSWSPVRARVRNRNVSTIPATVISDWPTPTVSTSTDVVPRRLEHRHRLGGGAGDPAEGAGRGRGTDVGVGIGGERGHPGLVTEHRPAGADAGRVDSQDTDPLPRRRQPGAELAR